MQMWTKILVVFCCLFPVTALASDVVVVVGQPTSAACTLVETYGDSSGIVIGGFVNANRKFAASQFDVGGTGYTATKIELEVDYAQGGDGTPEGTVTPYLCADSADEPACADATCTACTAGTPVAISAFPTAADTWHPFMFAGYSLSASTTYWVVLVSDEVGDDEDVDFGMDNAGEGNDYEVDSDAASWLEDRNDVQIMIRGYSGGC